MTTPDPIIAAFVAQQRAPLNALQSVLNGQAAPSFAAGALQTTLGN